MKKQDADKDTKTGLRELSLDELNAVNGGKLSQSYCNQLAAFGFWASYEAGGC